MYDCGTTLWLIALWLIEVQIGTQPISPASQMTASMNIIQPEREHLFSTFSLAPFVAPFFRTFLAHFYNFFSSSEIGIVELRLERLLESWTFGEISLLVMFSARESPTGLSAFQGLDDKSPVYTFSLQFIVPALLENEKET